MSGIKDRDRYNAYMREYILARYHRRMTAAKQQLGVTCAKCPASEDLELDHIDWRLKSLPMNRMWSVSEARFQEELAKCQLLCHSHHREKTRQDMREIKRERGGANQYARYGPR